jgi:hypothetical protein
VGIATTAWSTRSAASKRARADDVGRLVDHAGQLARAVQHGQPVAAAHEGRAPASAESIEQRRGPNVLMKVGEHRNS